jgi:hypothetical protein
MIRRNSYEGNILVIRELNLKKVMNVKDEKVIIRKINLRFRIDHIRGIYLYKKLGFSEEGHGG